MLGRLTLVLGALCAACAGAEPVQAPAATPHPALEQVEKHVTARGNADVIRVFRPRRGATVASPLIVRGQARGPWYFEATFPVRVLDAKGQVLVESYATARSEWMTESYVPFELELRFTPKPGERGSLVLEKANASGLPEHEDELVIPIAFQQAPLHEPD